MGKVHWLVMKVIIFMFLLVACVGGQISVTTAQYDANRTGTNSAETTLHPNSVSAQRFGKLFTHTVDDTVYASPLVLSGIRLSGNKSPRNIMVVATMSNTVYAFDADDAKRTSAYWTRKLGVPGIGDAWIGPVNHGILSTPVFDPSTGTLYLIAKVRSGTNTGLWLHALDITNGGSKYSSPTQISFPYADGTLVTNVPGAIQRTGLLLWNSILYAGFANILLTPNSDYATQEGFVQSFDARNLSRRLGNFQVTPSGQKGGVWQAGRGLAADASGVYVSTSGGTYDGVANFGSSLVKLSHGSLAVLDWFTPANHEMLFHSNLDLSANGIALIPNTTYAFGGGKEGIIYLFERASMGHLETGPASLVQKFQATSGCGQSDCAQTIGTSFWSGLGEGRLFTWDRGDVLRSYVYRNSRFETTISSQSAMRPAMTGGPAVSSNGTDLDSVIVWAITADQNANSTLVNGTLRAFRGANVSQELYNSDQRPTRDAMGYFTKFAPPVIANGQVYVITHSNTVSVYGRLTGNGLN